MKRMSLYKMICYCCLIWGTMACTKEDTPEAMWEYTGPVPAILDAENVLCPLSEVRFTYLL